MKLLEKTGDQFNLDSYLGTRHLCIEVVARIVSRVFQGMNQENGQQIIKEEFAKAGVSKFWRPSKFRISSDKFNPLMTWHRLGDFPHALFCKIGLSSLEIVPSENLWVLEIHIVNESLQRGSFFEDILSH